jgi:hypothetical protein
VPRENFTPRPYPRRIAGTPGRFRVDLTSATRAVELSWVHAPATGSTEIYVPARVVFGTDTVTVTPSGPGLSCAVGFDLVRCSSPTPGPVQIRITAGP